MDNVMKARENRIRRMLGRQGYTLSKNNRRDPRAYDYGHYTISQNGEIVFGATVGRTLDDAEKWAMSRAEPAAPGIWEKAGEVCVDTARLMLADPCYDLPEDFLNSLCEDGVTACRPAARPLFRNAATAMMVVTGMGDGFYPVEVRRTADGRVAAVRVTFLTDEGEYPALN
jgi:hypothetical protein